MSTSPTPATGGGQGAPPGPGNRPSNTIWWVLGFFVLAICVVVVGGFLTAGYVVRNIRVDQKSQQVSVNTPAGSVTLRTTDSIKDVGLPIYPGAEIARSGGGVEVTAPNDKRVAVAGVKYRTDDSVEKVDAWYRERLSADFERHGPGEKWSDPRIGGVTIETDDIAFVAEGSGLIRVVAIKKRGNGAEIDMVRIGKQETQ